MLPQCQFMYIFAPELYKYTQMDIRSKRLQAIKKIISQQSPGTQEELLEQLMQEGFEVTQATISRDLRFLQVGRKAHPHHGMVYYLPDMPEASGPPPEYGGGGGLSEAVERIHFANGFGIIKTYPGFANSVAIGIDKAGRFEIAGTIAGDDTILIIPDNDIDASELKAALQIVFPALKDHVFSGRQ